MGSAHQDRDPRWKASFIGGPHDGLVTEVGGFEGPVPYNYTVPIPSDDDGFEGMHTYFVTDLDLVAKVCEFTYTGELWTAVFLED